MKKILFFLLIVLFALPSCKNDKDDIDYSKSIIGSWAFNKISKMSLETNSKIINSQIAEGLKDIDKADYSQYNGYLLFTEEGTYKSELNGLVEEGTYTLDGRTLTTTSSKNETETMTIYISSRVLEVKQESNKRQIKEQLEKLADQETLQQVKALEELGIQLTRLTIVVAYTKP